MPFPTPPGTFPTPPPPCAKHGYAAPRALRRMTRCTLRGVSHTRLCEPAHSRKVTPLPRHCVDMTMDVGRADNLYLDVVAVDLNTFILVHFIFGLPSSDILTHPAHTRVGRLTHRALTASCHKAAACAGAPSKDCCRGDTMNQALTNCYACIPFSCCLPHAAAYTTYFSNSHIRS